MKLYSNEFGAVNLENLIFSFLTVGIISLIVVYVKCVQFCFESITLDKVEDVYSYEHSLCLLAGSKFETLSFIRKL